MSLEDQCSEFVLEKYERLRFSSLCPDRQGPCKSVQGQGNFSADHTTVVGTAIVSNTTTVIYSTSNTSSSVIRFVIRPQRPPTSSDNEEQASLGGLESFRQKLTNKGISVQATSLIEKCRRKGTGANYQSAWGKWSSWCGQRQVDPFNAPLNCVLDFLTNLFDKHYQYRTINNHRSAISAFHPKIEGFPVGQHPLVCNLLAGIFNERPPQPRYQQILSLITCHCQTKI